MSLYFQRLNFLLQTSAIALVYMEQASGFLKTVQKMLFHAKRKLSLVHETFLEQLVILSLISFFESKAVCWFCVSCFVL